MTLPSTGPEQSQSADPIRLTSGRLHYTTPLGAQYSGDSRLLLGELPAESVDLFVTSPPFPLLRPKEYGNADQNDYVEWLLPFAAAAHRALRPTGSLVMEVGGAYQRGRPTRSLHQFRILLACTDRLGFHLAQEFYWHNPSRLPTPAEWVTKRKIRAKDTVNTIWWLSKTPHPKADTTKLKTPYSKSMKKLLAAPARHYRPMLRPSGHTVSEHFGQDTGGALPATLLSVPNSTSNDAYLRECRLHGTRPHPARYPARIPEFFITLCTNPGDLVVDFFSGSNTTGHSAELLGRRWLGIDLDTDYAAASAARFPQAAVPA
ncbi:site-specific DNA-methyltransferase [Streptomyces sp. NPDC006923]|uniref:DNA-methyltransferase n=1 Tax=Streptomyces sp. NPDC006923 TaxID=3155355 RepID=UPI0033EA7A81